LVIYPTQKKRPSILIMNKLGLMSRGTGGKIEKKGIVVANENTGTGYHQVSV